MYYLFSYIVLTRNVNLKNVLVKDCIIIIKKIGFQTIFLKLNSSKTEIILVGSKNTITKSNISSVVIIALFLCRIRLKVWVPFLTEFCLLKLILIVLPVMHSFILGI